MITVLKNNKKEITSWKQFRKQVRNNNDKLLTYLEKFPNSILVSGCQRSGTTILSRIITQSEGMVNYWVEKDDELDAAVILSGKSIHSLKKGRYCFQTTYLNENYTEYFDHMKTNRLIWVIRNPYSVVYSMLYNWSKFALNELFAYCGASMLSGVAKKIYEMIGLIGVKPIKKACLSYNSKNQQLFNLQDKISKDKILVINYEDLVDNPETLKSVFMFADLKYKDEYYNKINMKSVQKANRLNKKQKEVIEKICMPFYLKVQSSFFYEQN